jgi:hypothetical protein
MTIRHGKSTNVISQYHPIRDNDVYTIAVDDLYVETIATQMRITVEWFRRRYLTFDRDTQRWSIQVTGADLKERIARADNAHLRSPHGPGITTTEELEDQVWHSRYQKPVTH